MKDNFSRNTPVLVRLTELEKALLKDLTTADPTKGKIPMTKIVGDLIQAAHKKILPEKWEGSEYIES